MIERGRRGWFDGAEAPRRRELFHEDKSGCMKLVCVGGRAREGVSDVPFVNLLKVCGNLMPPTPFVPFLGGFHEGSLRAIVVPSVMPGLLEDSDGNVLFTQSATGEDMWQSFPAVWAELDQALDAPWYVDAA